MEAKANEPVKRNAFDAMMGVPKSKTKVAKSKVLVNWLELGSAKSKSGGTIPSVLVGNFGDLKASAKIAAFDMDGTIIDVKSGAKFAKDINDWIFKKFAKCTVQEKLTKLHSQGYKIVVFTNQGGVRVGQLTLNALKQKLIKIISAMDGVPVQVFAAMGDDEYRKPRVGMWELLDTVDHNAGVEIDLENCFYVGDAAGRDKRAGMKKDHSDTDRKFALNVGIEFYTPEEYFDNMRAAPYILSGFAPKSLLNDNGTLITTSLLHPPSTELTSSVQEMVVNVGYPASGKTTFYNTYFRPNDYVHVNMDTLKTAKKCLQVCEESLIAGKSVVIDNTNPTIEVRKAYIALAKTYNVLCRCFQFPLDKLFAIHCNVYRAIYTKTVDRLSIIAFHTFAKRLELPTEEEGFDKVVVVNFIPSFSTDKDKAAFFSFL